MGRYRHYTIEEREETMCLLRQGKSISEIARALNRSKSTVSREIRRNSCKKFYRASTADRKSKERRARCVRKRRMDDPGLRALVQAKIVEERWSPEQIAGRLALERPGARVSASTIYRAIEAGALDTPELSKTPRGISGRLRHKGKRRRGKGKEERRGKIPNATPIGLRPGEADARGRLGDWEGDTVVGPAPGPCLVTLVDRASRYLEGGLSPAHRAEEVAGACVAALSGHPLETLTFDRGKEFASHERMARELSVPVFFALPHHPWQRGIPGGD